MEQSRPENQMSGRGVGAGLEKIRWSMSRKVEEWERSGE